MFRGTFCSFKFSIYISNAGFKLLKYASLVEGMEAPIAGIPCFILYTAIAKNA